MLKHWSALGHQIVRTARRRASLLIVAAFLVLSSSLAAINTTPSMAATIDDGADAGESVGGSSVTTCAIEQVGWVICPTIRTIAKLADYGFAFININYLSIGYEITANDSGTYRAWEQIRNIANILFVIVFLYIIYAEITGRNAGSYNIKRILPRLIIGAVLVNISYYLCAAAASLSDITGSIILGILAGENGIASQIGPAAMSLNNAENGFEDGILTDLTTNMLTKSGVVWVLLAPITAITISVALVSAAGIVLLIARKVIVAMLVLVSPLLFVTYMLPNLEHYFKQWIRLFTQLLLLFPVVAFLLGAGQIISATIIKVGSGGESTYAVDGDAYQARNGGSGSAMTDLAAAGAAVLPLLGVWFMMKGLSSVMTTAGSRIASSVSRGGSKESAKKLEAKLSKQGMSSTAGNINIVGGKVNIFDRKPAFTRMTARKRHATPGGSRNQLSKNSPYDGNKAPSATDRALTGAFGGNLLGGDGRKKAEMIEAAEAVQELNNANIAAQQANIAAAMQGAQAANGGDKKDGSKSSSQLLSELNKPRQQSRAGGGGGGQAGGGGEGGGPAGGTASETRIPTMSQPLMEAPVQSSSKPSGGPISVVTEQMPQVDASSLITPRGASLQSAPTSEMEQKAKAHAQKYLFDSAEDIEKAAARQEELDEMNKKAAKDLGKTKKKGE